MHQYLVKKLEKTAEAFHGVLLRERKISTMLSNQIQEDNQEKIKLLRKYREKDKKLQEYARYLQELKRKKKCKCSSPPESVEVGCGPGPWSPAAPCDGPQHPLPAARDLHRPPRHAPTHRPPGPNNKKLRRLRRLANLLQ